MDVTRDPGVPGADPGFRSDFVANLRDSSLTRESSADPGSARGFPRSRSAVDPLRLKDSGGGGE